MLSIFWISHLKSYGVEGYNEDIKEELIILLLDFEKAYERVD